jgi:DNA-binding NarL/FixJ family response regulator
MTKSVRVINLSKPLRRLYVRSLSLNGAGSQAKWIESQIRRYVVETREKFGEDLFSVLTPEEEEIVRVMRLGAWTVSDIVRESMLSEKRVREILDDLIERKMVEARKKGGRAEISKGKGAVTVLYAVIER